MSVVLDMSRGFDNVVHMQNLIGDCEVKGNKLKSIVDNLDKKEKEFTILKEYYARFCSAKEELSSYENSFWWRHFGFLPQVKDKFSEIDSEYRSSLDKFRCELAKRGIADERVYLVRANNFDRHYARRGEFKEKLIKVEREKNDLIDALKKLNVRVWDECLSGLPGDVLSVVKGLTSEQVLILKELNLPKIDYKSLLMLYEDYSKTLASLKDSYSKASSNLVNFSNVSRAISLYKKACLNHNVLSAADGKMLVSKVKSFMLKHNIRNIDEVHEKQLELKREMEDALQKIDDMSTKRDRIRPLLDIFRNDVDRCDNKRCENRKNFIVQ